MSIAIRPIEGTSIADEEELRTLSESFDEAVATLYLVPTDELLVFSFDGTEAEVLAAEAGLSANAASFDEQLASARIGLAVLDERAAAEDFRIAWEQPVVA